MDRSFIGKTVSLVRQHFKEVYQTTLGVMAVVNGKRVTEDFVLQEGQVVEFSDEAEDEDWAAEMHSSPEFWEMISQRRREEAIPWEEAKRRLGLD